MVYTQVESLSDDTPTATLDGRGVDKRIRLKFGASVVVSLTPAEARDIVNAIADVFDDIEKQHAAADEYIRRCQDERAAAELGGDHV